MRIVTLLLLLLCSTAHSEKSPDGVIRIAVAANFKATLAAVNEPFEKETGVQVVLSSASTGVLASQIIQGGPFDLFFAADRETPAKVRTLRPNRYAPSFCYATGALVLVGSQQGLAALTQPEATVAIANPATAPYGRAAMQVLNRSDFAAGAQRKLVRGNNVVQAYQFWHGGTVDLAVVPAALAPKAATPIPQAWHEPLAQHALVLRPSDAVNRYLKWIRSDTVRSLITQAGYLSCP